MIVAVTNIMPVRKKVFE